MTTKRVHWITAEGAVSIQENATLPKWDSMKEYIGGYLERVNVLYNGVQTTMWVHEEGRMQWEVRNEAATEIYFAMSKSQGIDPEDPVQAEEQLQAYAKSLGIPLENIIRTDVDDKKVGIYGPAILLEGFET